MAINVREVERDQLFLMPPALPPQLRSEKLFDSTGDSDLPSGLVPYREPPRTPPRTDECIRPRGIPAVMRVTTLKVGRDGLAGLIDYYAGLAADQLRRDGASRGPVTTTSTPRAAGTLVGTRLWAMEPLLTNSGGEVRNRHTWTVISVHRNGDLTVTDLDRGSVRLPAGYVARHVQLGWATTGYGNQGITVDAGIAVVEPSATRAGIYVAMTRGRHGNFAWIPDPTGRADAAEAFGEAIARPANAATAHATRDRLHRQAGLEPLTRRPVPPASTDPAQQMRARLDALSASPPPGRSLGR